MKKVWPYVKPFSSDTGMLRTDRRTDRQICYINIARMLTRDKNSRVRRIHAWKPTVHIIIISLYWNQVDKPQLATMTHTKQAATQDSTTVYNRTQSFGTHAFKYCMVCVWGEKAHLRIAWSVGDFMLLFARWLEEFASLALDLFCVIFLASRPWSARWGDRIQILTQYVHGGHIHFCGENKPIGLSRFPANRFITLRVAESSAFLFHCL